MPPKSAQSPTSEDKGKKVAAPKLTVAQIRGKVSVPIPAKVDMTPSSTEEDWYADPGVDPTPVRDMPSAEEMWDALTVPLPEPSLDEEPDVSTPVVVRDQQAPPEPEPPFDTVSVTSDLDEVKRDLQLSAALHKDLSGRVNSIEGAIDSLRYDVSAVSTQLFELMRLVERSQLVESDIQSRVERDESKGRDDQDQTDQGNIEAMRLGVTRIRSELISGVGEPGVAREGSEEKKKKRRVFKDY
jgi:hypothetical protein